MAFEMLAVMGSPLPTELADEAMSQTGMKIYIDRARTIGQTLHPKPAPRTYPTKRTKSRRTRPLRRRRPRR
jgi:hypothetical protein